MLSCDRASLVRDLGDGAVGLQQDGRVVRKPAGQQMPLDRRRGHTLSSGQARPCASRRSTLNNFSRMML